MPDTWVRCQNQLGASVIAITPRLKCAKAEVCTLETLV
jgi:hypothetical protein